jgi:hypothetical protein
MHTDKQLKAATIERLGEQSGWLLKRYRSELAKDPDSQATKSSRSNLIALLHTIHVVYGASISGDVTNALRSTDLPADSDK